MLPRKKLSDILRNGERDRLGRVWSDTEAADDLRPIPPGEYCCRVISGELFSAKSGTAGFKLAFQITEGVHAGRRAWLDVWLSEAALPLAKRDLSKLGIASLEQLERPIPPGIIANVKIALRRGDSGDEFNRVTRFDVVGIEPPKADPFAPEADGLEAIEL